MYEMHKNKDKSANMKKQELFIIVKAKVPFFNCSDMSTAPAFISWIEVLVSKFYIFLKMIGCLQFIAKCSTKSMLIMSLNHNQIITEVAYETLSVWMTKGLLIM